MNQCTICPCLFCDIVERKYQKYSEIEVETDDYVIFKDIHPASTYHYLCVPKRHIDSLLTMNRTDIPLINIMEEGLVDFFKSKNIDINESLFGFHMPPCISVDHLHMHGIAPISNMSLQYSFMFDTSTRGFKTVESARNYLADKPKVDTYNSRNIFY